MIESKQELAEKIADEMFNADLINTIDYSIENAKSEIVDILMINLQNYTMSTNTLSNYPPKKSSNNHDENLDKEKLPRRKKTPREVGIEFS